MRTFDIGERYCVEDGGNVSSGQVRPPRHHSANLCFGVDLNDYYVSCTANKLGAL